MHLKLSLFCFVLHFIYIQVESLNLESESNETISNLDDFKLRTLKIITNVNSNYENLIPEEKFAAHLMKKAVTKISNSFIEEILLGVNDLKPITNSTDFTSCTDLINFPEIMETYDTCIENITHESGHDIGETLKEAITFTDTKLTDVTKLSEECNTSKYASNCNIEFVASLQTAFEDILTSVNEINRLILSTYQSAVKEMPLCATGAMHSSLDIGKILKCVVLIVKENP